MKIKNLFKILMICTIVIPALIVSVVGSALFNSFLSSMITEEAVSAATTASEKADAALGKYSASLAVISRLDIISKAVGGDYATNAEAVDAVINGEVAGDESVLDLAILDTSGIVVASSSAGTSSVQKTFLAYGDELIATEAGGVYVSPLFIGNDTYFESVFAVVKPVATESGSTGYIAYVISADKFAAVLAPVSFLTEGKLMYVDTNGAVVNYNGNSVSRYEDVSSSPFIAAINEVKNDAIKDGNAAQLSAGGWLGAYGLVGDTDWGWIGYIPSSIIGAAAVNPILLGIVVFIVFTLINALIAFAVYKKSISPIGKVVGTIKDIKDGDREKRLPMGNGYEFDIISDIFNATLDDSYISEEIHRTVSDLSENMLFEWNLDENRMYASDNFKAMFDIDIDKTTLLDGKFLDSLMSDTDGLKFRRELSTLLNQKRDFYEGEFKVRARDCSEIWIGVRAKIVTNRLGDVLRIIGVVTNINNEKKAQISLSQRASFDFLSQLYNRSTFLRELQNHLDLKSASENISILFVDVDDFKFINDRYGHNVGDEVIKFVSDTLKSKIGEDGFAGRFGGDEFVICSLNPKTTEVIDDFAMGIIDALYQGYRCESVQAVLNIRASIGIALYPQHGKDSNELVGAADEAMYFVKKNGKSNYHVYDPADAPDLDQENTIV